MRGEHVYRERQVAWPILGILAFDLTFAPGIGDPASLQRVPAPRT